MTPTAEAVVLVTGLQQDARAEAASRGALIRKTARLFTVTYTLAAGRALEGWVRQDSFRTSPQAGMRNRAQTPARTRTEVLRDAEDEARHYIAGELEMALLIPHGSALELLRQAIVLVVHLPQVLDRLEAGEILWDQVRVILDQWSALSAIHFPTPLLDPSILDKHTASDLGLTAEFGEDNGDDGDDHAAPLAPPTQDAASDGDGADRVDGADGADGADANDELTVEAQQLAQEMLTRATDSGAAKLRAFGTRRRHALGQTAADRARTKARRQRSVWIEPEEDGMAHLHAILEAHTALAVFNRIDRMAQSQPTEEPEPRKGQHDDGQHLVAEKVLSAQVIAVRRDGAAHNAVAPAARADQANESDDRRTLSERRADVLSDLLMDAEPQEGSHLPRGIRGHVSVVVPVEHLMAADPTLHRAAGRPGPGLAPSPPGTGGPPRRASGQPPATPAPPAPPAPPRAAELIGFGPISPSAAAEVAAESSSWKRLLCDSGTGEITQYGRETYAVPAGLRRHLQVRDGTCRFPGCRRQALRCDVDHSLAWEDGGCTDAQNLAHLCRGHHRLKHHVSTFGPWRVEPDVSGTAPGDGHDLEDNHGQQQSGPKNRAQGSCTPHVSTSDLKFTSPLGTVRRSLPEHEVRPGGRPGILESSSDDSLGAAPSGVGQPGSRSHSPDHDPSGVRGSGTGPTGTGPFEPDDEPPPF